ncbi:5'-nucleotidase, lipoprotein e(P4) family [Anoxybacteroides rupiense]|uniref:5'-nucleotidase, lipoprotein e(P4) family n=1 Tax=Anoxybacteroides rupiense TaxID=311460 RepID=UPI001605FD1C|nr:5'-nucleotidase, lipoprotein e(P4) family [Anoxybacillus rupiensis]MBB3908110.1 5'-nucleotidase (lipoprotein e(P4) family) [Anoxybacillus rupiensis]
MNKWSNTLSGLIAASIFSFSVFAVNAETAIAPQSVEQTVPSTSNNEHMLMATLWYQKSGEMQALYYQAYNLGKMVVDDALKQKRNSHSRKKLAIVLDIDETILNNSPYEAYIIQKGVPNFTDWHKWVMQAQAEALPGAVEFLTYVDSKGIDIFYVSNRDENEGKATIKNLKEKGFPQATADHMLFRAKENSKEPRRQKIQQTHEIVALFGDNLSDFTKEFDQKPLEERNANVDRFREEFGRKFIVLPNPMYGDWENAIYGYDLDQTFAEKAKVRKQALNAYPLK